MADGKVTIQTQLNSEGFKKDVNDLTRNGTRSFNTLNNSVIKTEHSINNMAGSLKRIAGLLATGFSIGSLVKFGKQSLELASDLTEVQNVVDTAFGSMSSKMEAFAQTSVDTYGISKLSAKNIASTYAAMAQGMGQGLNEATDKALEMTGRVADIASFYNLTLDRVNTIGRAVYSGETEPLKQIGVIMTEAQLQTFALSNGYKTLYKNMSAAEKLEVRQAYFLAQTNLAAGDFVRTQNSWANQTRILSERWKEFLAIVGTGLVQALKPALQALNSFISKITAALSSVYKLLGVKIEDSVGKGISDVSSDTDGLSTSIGGVEKATKKATKSAKAGIRAFDELVNISTNSTKSPSSSNTNSTAPSSPASSNTNSTAPSSPAISITPTVDEKSFNSVSSLLDTLKNKLTSLQEEFKKGFNLSIGTNTTKAFSDITKSLDNIKKTLSSIFTDPTLTTSAKTYVDSVAYLLGSLAGFGTSIGITIATNLLGGFSNYLTRNKDYIVSNFGQIFNNLSNININLASLYQSLGSIFEVFRTQLAQSITGDLFTIINNTIIGFTTLFTSFASSISTLFTVPIVNNVNSIKEAFTNTLQAIQPLTNSFATFITSLFTNINTTYTTYLAPALQNIANSISSVFSTVLQMYNQYVAPTLKTITTWIAGFISSSLTPFVSNVLTLIGKIGQLISSVVSTVITPVMKIIVKTIIPSISKKIQSLAKVILSIITTVTNVANSVVTIFTGIVTFLTGIFTLDINKVISGVKTTLNGVITFIKTLFTGIPNIIGTALVSVGTAISAPFKAAFNTIKDIFKSDTVKTFFSGVVSNIQSAFSTIANWFKSVFTTAWTNVKAVFSAGGKVFTGIKDGILNGLKTVINTLIKGINTIISIPFKGLNKALKSIHDLDILGVKPFGFIETINVPQIPMLATGAVLPANKPFLSVVGDQKHGTNIEAPLSTIVEAMNTALSKQKQSSSDIIINVDGRELFKIMQDRAYDYKTRTGNNAFLY